MRALFLAGLSLVGADPPDDLEWWDDLKVAREEAGRAGKPLFVVFRCEP
jgi:hypothetical protein